MKQDCEGPMPWHDLLVSKGHKVVTVYVICENYMAKDTNIKYKHCRQTDLRQYASNHQQGRA